MNRKIRMPGKGLMEEDGRRIFTKFWGSISKRRKTTYSNRWI
jgi:hypothetical protein